MKIYLEKSLNTTRSNLGTLALIAILAAGLALLPQVTNAAEDESPSSSRNLSRLGLFDMTGVSDWLKQRFNEDELDKYQAEDFAIEQQLCNCSDRPVPHYPYVLMFFSTPKGDLVGRPERRGFDTVIIPLAVRHGERYCELESEDQCYGSFSNPCDFSDFRYASQLAPYFPGCLEVEPDTELEPVRYEIKSAR
ncbi:MAG: hypothetical protein JSW48_12925 [Betaproteobacteria bacterium]|jgi:hypothetical protein|nr:MAG: hypothetical protein JSW48_12925 [Betaproteobacteria bacterium]